MKEKQTNRYYWLDIAKSIGIFVIVLSHSTGSLYTAAFLWTFNVPLFFFISGFLFKSTPSDIFLNRLKSRLILPYIYIYLINALLVVLIKFDFNINSIIAMVLGMFWGARSYSYFDLVNGALWFLPALIIVELIHFYLIRKSPWFYLPLLSLSIFFYSQGYLNLFLSIDLALLGLNYYIAGVLVRKFNIIGTFKTKPVMLMLVFVLSLLATLKFADSGVSVWYGGKFYLASLMGGILGIAMIISLSFLLETCLKSFSFISFISANTLFIFCFHRFSKPLVSSVIDAFIMPSLLSSLLVATLSILILIPVNILVIKYLPQIIGIKKLPPDH